MRLDSPLLALALPAVLALAAAGLLAPEAFRAATTALTQALLGRFGGLVLATATGALLLVTAIALSPAGRRRLGPANARPEFATHSWLAMLFAAGMGTGLVVWGVAEPVTHALSPPGGPLPPRDAARTALLLTNLHWGLHAWAIYALAALVIAWFAHVRSTPMRVSAPIATLIPSRPLALAADTIALLAVACGVAATLAMGMLSFNAAARALGLAPAPFLALALVGTAAILSAALPIGRGIRRLSDLNLLLALALMGLLLALGPTARLLETFAASLLHYLGQLPRLSIGLGPPARSPQWRADWTYTYFLWWLAWGPFVGLFIARISAGRTVRAFVAGVVLVPALGSLLWFAIQGGLGLERLALEGPAGPLATAVRTDPTSALFTLLEAFPAAPLLVAAAALLLLIFLVTSVDSAILVLAIMSLAGSPGRPGADPADPPVPLRLAWGLALLALAAAILGIATVETARAIAILGALPYPLLLALQAVALLRDLSNPKQNRESP